MPPKRKRVRDESLSEDRTPALTPDEPTPDAPDSDDIQYWTIETKRTRSVKAEIVLENESPEFGDSLGANLRHTILFNEAPGAWESLASYRKWNIDGTGVQYYVGDYIAVLTERPDEEEEDGDEVDEADGADGNTDGKASAKKTKQTQRRDQLLKHSTTPEIATQAVKDDDIGGIAKVLECRAIDDEHVYLRIQWLYKAHELYEPYGPEPYHADNELFPSTHYQLIDATTCNGLVEVVKWEPGMEELGESGWGREGNEGRKRYCWRQTYDFMAPKSVGPMSRVKTYCVCKKPADLSGEDPEGLVMCLGMGSKPCGKWLHPSCLCGQAEKDAMAKDRAETGRADGVPPEPSTQSKVDGKLKSLKAKKSEPAEGRWIKASWNKAECTIELVNERTGTKSEIKEPLCLFCQSRVGDRAIKQEICNEGGMNG
jgi:hypothetical protein